MAAGAAKGIINSGTEFNVQQLRAQEQADAQQAYAQALAAQAAGNVEQQGMLLDALRQRYANTPAYENPWYLNALGSAAGAATPFLTGGGNQPGQPNPAVPNGYNASNNNRGY
jgi:hypothetical protein